MMTFAPRIARGDGQVRLSASAIALALVVMPAASNALRSRTGTRPVKGNFVPDRASCVGFLAAFSPAPGEHKGLRMQGASGSTERRSVT